MVERHDHCPPQRAWIILAVSAIVTSAMATGVSAADRTAPEAPSTVEQCAARLGAPADFIVRFAATSQGPRFAPALQIDVEHRTALQPLPLEDTVACWQKALGMPDPKRRSVSLSFGFGMLSQAPGLDASVRDQRLADAGQRTASESAGPSMQTTRLSLPDCMTRYLGTAGSVARTSVAFQNTGGQARLVGWDVTAPDPGGLDERESFQLFARCMTRAIGTSLYLEPIEIADGSIVARSRR
jgi:hypothetical protein